MTVKAHCPDCEEAGEDNPLQLITPTGQRRNPDKGTDEWWRLVSHKQKKTGQFCPGSGRLV